VVHDSDDHEPFPTLFTNDFMTSSKTVTTCRVCASHEPPEWLYPQEMMYGLREKFSYFRCAACGCLQIDQVPANLDKYYPTDYYSYQNIQDGPCSLKTAIKRKLFFPLMTRHKLGWGSVAGRLLCRFRDVPPFPEWLRFLARPIPLNGGVLDVGCGSGFNLLTLRNCGFTNLLGVDPFIHEPVAYFGGVRVEKCNLKDVQRRFSLITLHHVFEHLDNPLETLNQARQLLSPDGQILIRIPLSDSFAAQKYKEKWVQLDAPRHVTLQTRKSMGLLAEKSGMKIVRVVYDSTEFQFWGSEQYLLDIPIMDKRSYQNNPAEKIFNDETIKSFAEQSQKLNVEQKGDQAAFIFVRK
jgi:SAM-dependent methyltransferase